MRQFSLGGFQSVGQTKLMASSSVSPATTSSAGKLHYLQPMGGGIKSAASVSNLPPSSSAVASTPSSQPPVKMVVKPGARSYAKFGGYPSTAMVAYPSSGRPSSHGSVVMPSLHHRQNLDDVRHVVHLPPRIHHKVHQNSLPPEGVLRFPSSERHSRPSGEKQLWRMEFDGKRMKVSDPSVIQI